MGVLQYLGNRTAVSKSRTSEQNFHLVWSINRTARSLLDILMGDRLKKNTPKKISDRAWNSLLKWREKVHFCTLKLWKSGTDTNQHDTYAGTQGKEKPRVNTPKLKFNLFSTGAANWTWLYWGKSPSDAEPPALLCRLTVFFCELSLHLHCTIPF